MQEEHIKTLDLEGDDEKHLKTQITAETSITATGTSKGKNIVTQNRPEIPKKRIITSAKYFQNHIHQIYKI